MKKIRIALIAGFAVLTLTGFVLGNAVNAAISGPGSTDDPLATKSYVDAEVAKLQTQITNLKKEVQELKK